MIVDTKSVGMAPEILASNDYQAVPVKLTATAKAGMPIKNDGTTSMDGKGAIGILLYDVDVARNPNGAVVVDGVIDWAKCKAHNNDTLSGMTAEAIAKELPNIVFRDGIATADSKTYTSGGVQASEAV